VAFRGDFHTFYEAAHESFLLRISELIVQLIEIEQECLVTDNTAKNKENPEM
jgi:hypothetical protein